ncbi:hypothetical protein, partial [Shewanella indica]|uniref:hypothetical protein n=1 Tax=Shewanella indica TaxID=768528 RepID=UPI00300461BE
SRLTAVGILVVYGEEDVKTGEHLVTTHRPIARISFLSFRVITYQNHWLFIIQPPFNKKR